MSRANRKKDHIRIFEACEFGNRGIDYFEQMKLSHNALPEIDFNDIDTSTVFLDKKIGYPIMINAITGGIEEVYKMNRDLAKVAKRFNIPMAVGSQSIAVKNKGDKTSFQVVREVMGDGVVIANIGAGQSYEHVYEAVHMIEADAIQLHINVAQEIIMPEGDRSFKGVIEHIARLKERLDCPIIVKEVGFGISGEVAKRLQDVGIEYIDVSGKGGTNFIEIEDQRNNKKIYEDFYEWGIPTPVCIHQCRQEASNLKLIASGGIQKADHIFKSLVLGSHIVGMSGRVLDEYLKNGLHQTESFIEDLLHKFKIFMLLTGCCDISKIQYVPYHWEKMLLEK
ncbi:type 2 isopentenyl-diphosphate Delta-isomerase [Vallitalea okinawensis]|uniref:type 2 isopentenyl-diphosphate Delta-isomerase n=1 Tax=Vallitalea okinawensis TaxID=2078660 RepID=UPI000CFAF44A|nr:type 2 isopentenyl-diphosphate Delta-isomerase [Vallitalea okinawensis]